LGKNVEERAMGVDVAHLQQWVGRSEVHNGRLDPFPATALAATLDRDDPEYTDGMTLPPLWHWLYFLPVHRMSEIGPDGHLQRGGFLPPVPLPRRMWAGGRLAFHHPLRLGETVRKESRVLSVEHKEGRSGPLVFVRVGHELANAQGTALTEKHDIVYRDLSAPPGAPKQAPTGAVWERVIRPDPVLLFRYSALTFNGHRIHYDQPYVTKVEGYPGLIVHGPLVATMLIDLLRRERPDATVKTFAFRAVGPLFDTAEFAVCGAPAEDGSTIKLWARTNDGLLAMEASASLA
jgi:3-methylfumaryl-CoA hydratase